MRSSKPKADNLLTIGGGLGWVGWEREILALDFWKKVRDTVLTMYATLATQRIASMPEVSSNDAGRIIGVNSETIRRYVDRGILPARRVGLRGALRIEIEDLRKVAREYQYRFDEELAQQLAR